MRRRVSGKTRMSIIISSVIIFAVLLVFLIIEMKSLTTSLKDDISKADITCTEITILSSGQVNDLINNKSFNGLELEKTAVDTINPEISELCVVRIEYVIYSNIKEKLNDISIEIKNSEISQGLVYAFSNAELKSVQNNVYTLEQAVLMDKLCLHDRYLESEPPFALRGQFDYKLHYHVEGREKQNAIAFSTAKKV